MTMKAKSLILCASIIFISFLSSTVSLKGQEKLTINDLGYFEMPGFDVMVFDDYYPGGHQSGVTILQNGVRVAANGDIRIGLTPPARAQKKVDKGSGTIEAEINYPDISFKYVVRVKAAGNKIKIGRASCRERV